jgi:hypothetical protein
VHFGQYFFHRVILGDLIIEKANKTIGLFRWQTVALIVATHCHNIACCRFRVSASLLVGYQLSACCAKHEYAHL